MRSRANTPLRQAVKRGCSEFENGKTLSPETTIVHPRCAADLHESTHPQATRPVRRPAMGRLPNYPAVNQPSWRHEIGWTRPVPRQSEGSLEHRERHLASLLEKKI